MKEFKDLIGQTFNRWTIIGTSDKTNKHYDRYWLCQCSCKNKTVREVRELSLTTEKSKSCGCYSSEKTTAMNKERGFRDKYPYYKRIKSIYDGMRKRCYDENKDNYDSYGGRGISVCKEWLNEFMIFYEWALNNGYSNELTIDRIENDGNYEPSNCRWATQEEQDYNKRNTVYLEIDGEYKNVLEWEKFSGLSYSVLWQRYNIFGFRTKEEMFKPVRQITEIIHNGNEIKLTQLARETGIGVETLRWRYKQGFRDKELIRHPDRWAGHVKSTEKRVRKRKIKEQIEATEIREEVTTIGRNADSIASIL